MQRLEGRAELALFRPAEGSALSSPRFGEHCPILPPTSIVEHRGARGWAAVTTQVSWIVCVGKELRYEKEDGRRKKRN
jgi:hypothetical protein